MDQHSLFNPSLVSRGRRLPIAHAQPFIHTHHITPRSGLYADYEPDSFLWFAVQLIRSMLIVAIRVLASNWPPVQVTLAVLVRKGGKIHAAECLCYFV